MKRRLAAVLLYAGVALVLVAARAALGARAELRAGEAAWRAGRDADAVIAFGRGARWAVPPWSDRALGRLHDAATTAERQGRAEAARDAWSELRGALLGSRRWVVGDARLLAAANDHLSKLSGHPHRDGRPGAGWFGSLLSLAGLALWVGTAWWWSVRPRGRRTRLVAGFLLFVAGLAIA